MVKFEMEYYKVYNLCYINIFVNFKVKANFYLLNLFSRTKNMYLILFVQVYVENNSLLKLN